jgi:hypothetical protein
VSLYFKPKKLSSCFTLRPKLPDIMRHGLVYKFVCTEDSCNASYIGYTMNRLLTRAKQHKYSNSKIHSHFNNEHKIKPDQSIVDGFSILYNHPNYKNNRIAEALLIKTNKPYINVRYNGMASGLNIF